MSEQVVVITGASTGIGAVLAQQLTRDALTANFRDEVTATHPDIQFSLVSPGVVFTEFGLRAKHGGVDSRTSPQGQTPEAVAAVIAGVIHSRRPDVYTRAGARQMVLDYLGALGEDPVA